MNTARAQPHGHLPRLATEHYRGHAMVHWTLTLDRRETGWLSDLFHAQFRESLLHAQVRHHLACVTYCLMPDHLHLLSVGLNPDSDQKIAIRFLQQDVNIHLVPKHLQKQPYDHVLQPAERERGALRSIAYYILENPVRAQLARDAKAYPYSGCLVSGYPRFDVHDSGHWEKYWKIVETLWR